MAESVLESLAQEYKAKTNKLYNIQQVTKFSLNFTFYLKAKIILFFVIVRLGKIRS